MAVSTVSSLSETFVSGAPLEIDEGAGEKEKQIRKGDAEASPENADTSKDSEAEPQAEPDGQEKVDVLMGDGEAKDVAPEPNGDGETKGDDAGLVSGQEKSHGREGDGGNEEEEDDEHDGGELQVHS